MWLLLESDLSKTFNLSKKYNYLLPLNKVNIMVGKNNSGKSYLMREIIKKGIKILSREEIKELVLDEENFNFSDHLDAFHHIDVLSAINDKYFTILNQINNFNNLKIETSSIRASDPYHGRIYSFRNFSDLVSESSELIEYLGIINKNDSTEFSDKVIYDMEKNINRILTEYRLELSKMFDSISDDDIYQFGIVLYCFGYVKNQSQDFHEEFNQLDKEAVPDSFKVYIPLMRSIRDPLKNPEEKLLEPFKNIFKHRIIKEYSYNESEVDVITGLDFYYDYKKKLLGSKQERELINDFETFLSNYFFEGKEISIIPDEKTYELKINIEDKSDRFIYEVGDGVASLIIIMYKMFLNLNSKGMIYFVEEPEQSFHPGFQRLFMNIISLNEKFKNCYFFFTTHSNHLIDISSNEFNNFTSYLCKKDNNEITVKIQCDADIEVIEELGVQPSSVQIANKIIWVEGKYDAFYIRLLLNKKNININDRKYIEEYDYVFVPYGGSNGTLINFSIDNEIESNKEFILRARKINSNMLIIMDDDGIMNGKCGENKLDRYKQLKAELEDSLYKLEVREIENLFPPNVIKKFFINGLKSKDINLSFLDSINHGDYKFEKLGEYYNNLIKKNIGEDLKNITGRTNGFENKGFLYNKSKFYDCVLEWINKEDFNYERDLPLEIKELIDVIENFIKKN